ncbi:MAG TPA: alpha/beta hydrolase, partial [Gaiellaceae bacterium]
HAGGDAGGLPVIVHHGTPSSGLLYEKWTDDAAAKGIRLIGFDRAGYGGSTRLPGRTIAAAAADTEAIADALELERFATWGISGGGPHALACAALCGSRLTAAASLAGVAPWDAEGLDWLAGTGEANIEEFDLVLAGEEALRPAVERDRAGLLAGGPDDLTEAMESLLGDADRAVLATGLAVWMDAVHSNGLRDSGDGWIDDDLAFAAPWGFEPGDIERPVLIVQGGDDRFVPRSHGEWLAAHVPGSDAWIDDADGHLTLLEQRIPEVHEWLLAHS